MVITAMKTLLLANPFMNPMAVEPSAAGRAVASTQPPEATARWDFLFDAERQRNLLVETCVGLRDMEPKWFEWVISGEPIDDWLDEPPLFLSRPSPEYYIEALHRDVLSVLEDHVRRAG